MFLSGRQPGSGAVADEVLVAALRPGSCCSALFVDCKLCPPSNIYIAKGERKDDSTIDNGGAIIVALGDPSRACRCSGVPTML